MNALHSSTVETTDPKAGKNRSPVTVFHGSANVVERPVFGFGKRTNDYGLGFYCTEDRALAGEWGVTSLHDGFINRYQLDLSGLVVLDLTDGTFTVLHWLAILLENRTFDIEGDMASAAKDYLLATFRPDYADADVIVGYRANDSYFSFARTFLSGALSYAHLARAIRLGNLGLQVVAKSRKAFGALSFVSAEPAKRSDFLDSKERRDSDARREFRKMRTQPFDPSGLYMLNILQERIRPDDPRLQ